LKRKELAEAIEFPRQTHRGESIKILPPEEVERLIREAPTLQERLIVELFSETGARRGEIANIAIRDIQFDQYGAIVWLHGKTGSRRRRVYGCVADLREHINNHPLRDKPNAPLFFKTNGKPYHYGTFYKCIKRLGKRILDKDIYPHMLRHTKATEDSRYFTDREMMSLFGWKGPQMVGLYSHLSMRDVEDKDLMVHGMKPREEVLRPLAEAQICSKCSQENAPIAIYCVKCGAILPNEQLAGLDKILAEPEFMKRLINSESFKDALQKALGE
jgi:integrase/ribosomal protein L40E